ncbi:MAG: DUF4920 domain-containing protein [Planctomycetota bacterium]
MQPSIRHPRPHAHLAFLLTVTVVSLAACSSSPTTSNVPTPDTPHQGFGEPLAITTGTPVTDIDTVMADPDAHVGRDLVLAGTVRKVCQKRGCWMTLGSDDLGRAVMVKFTCPIDGHLIPAAAAGQPALAAGRLELRDVSEAYARHLAEDNGATPDQVARIVGPQPMLWLAAPAARVYGLPPEPPEVAPEAPESTPQTSAAN